MASQVIDNIVLDIQEIMNRDPGEREMVRRIAIECISKEKRKSTESNRWVWNEIELRIEKL